MQRYFLIFFSCFCAHLNSQSTTNDSITPLDEVLVIEKGIQKKVVGITPSSSLDTKELSRYSPLDFANAINQIPGVYLLSGALNTNRITIRGVGARTPFGTDNLRLYFNNIPITDGTGVSTIEAFDLENLGAIEVIKGPKATTFGTNLGGAIIIDTSAPEVGTTQLSNSFTLGSFNLIKDNLSFRHSQENFNLNVSYNRLETDGFRQNNRFERDGILVTSALRVGSKDKLDFLFSHIDYTAQIPSTINQNDFNEDPTRAAANWLAAQGFEANSYTLAGLTYTHAFGPTLNAKASIFYTYLDHFEPRPFNILDEFTNGFGFRTVFYGKLGEGSYTFGSELYKDEYNWGTFQNLFEENNGNGSLAGARLSRNKEFRSQLFLFGTFTYPIAKRLQAQLGINYNATDYDFRDLFNLGDSNTSAERNFDPILLPNIGLQYALKNGQLYGNVGRGFSNPSLEESLTPDGVINPDIAQETGVNYEIGGSFNFLKNRLQLTTALYRMRIQNLLVADRVGEDQFIGRNAGETRHQGLEMALNYRFSLSDKWALFPLINYTLNDHSFIDFVDGDNDFSGNPLTGVPKHNVNSSINLTHANGFQLHLTHQFVDEIPLTDANTLTSEAFSVFQFQVKYNTQFSGPLNFGLNFGMNNIFDTNYAQSVLINANGFGGNLPRFFWPGNGRNFYGGLKLRYLL